MVERKNRDLKTQLGILVGNNHPSRHLLAIRFAMNSTRSESTKYSPAFLTFERELLILQDLSDDLGTI